ncbi:Substance-P receptor [Crenichthys baileyi]|uniref:Substance-P receptor n=1 Tax=Crenichthys baileyi TaxID=28760 RepID=A0AAV9RIJ8_9TELE
MKGSKLMLQRGMESEQAGRIGVYELKAEATSQRENRRGDPGTERYMAIIHPLQQRMSSTETKVVVGVIWVLALLLAFPQYYYSTTDQLPGRVVCYIEWPDYTTFDFKKM